MLAETEVLISWGNIFWKKLSLLLIHTNLEFISARWSRTFHSFFFKKKSLITKKIMWIYICPSEYHKENDGHVQKQWRGNWACRIFLLVMHLFSAVSWCFQVFGWVVCLAIQMPNICRPTWLCFFKESCLQSHCAAPHILLLLVGLQTALYYLWLLSWWANCTNRDSILCSTCGFSSTLLCSVLTAKGCCPISWVVSVAYKYLGFCHKLCSWIAKRVLKSQFPTSQ